MKWGGGGWHPCQKPEGHSWLGPLCPGEGCCGSSSFCLHPAGALGAWDLSLGTTLSLTLSFAQMTWCSLTVRQGGFAVAKMSTSRETFQGRDLCPLSISASVRNLLGHVVANKKEIPDFNLRMDCGFLHVCFAMGGHILLSLSFRTLPRAGFRS